MRTYHVPHRAFAPFAVTAHANAMRASHALFKKPLTVEDYEASKVIAQPIQVYMCMYVCVYVCVDEWISGCVGGEGGLAEAWER